MSVTRWTTVVLFIIFNFMNSFPIIKAWDMEDLELFDLVEEVNENFYEVFGIETTASSSDIRKAYRRLTLQYHPDKNKEEDAEKRFRQIVAISEVLKDEEKRKKYHEILENGLPDWRQPVYYYRHVRKMGLVELLLFLLALGTIGQYLFLWSVYWEKKFELEEIFTSKLKKIEKKNKKLKLNSENTNSFTEVMADELDYLQKPKFQELFPFQIVYFIIFLLKNIHTAPILYKNIKESFNKPAIEEDYESSDDESSEERVKKPRKRHTVELPDYSNIEYYDEPVKEENIENVDHVYEMKEISEWKESDYLMLTKAMKKFPGGCSNRWEKIGEMMNKPLSEVTKMAKKVKSSSYSTSVPTSVQGLTGHDDHDSSIENGDLKRRKAAKNPKAEEKTLTSSQSIPKSNDESTIDKSNEDGGWNQYQQRSLELALLQFPKGTEERWDKISACVQNKSKEECMLRFKLLAEIVKKKKSLKSS